MHRVLVSALLGLWCTPCLAWVHRWDNNQPIFGTQFVERARYEVGDLRGYDFRGLDLAYANLRGANLTDARLEGVGLLASDLRDAIVPDSLAMAAIPRSADRRGARTQSGQSWPAAMGNIQQIGSTHAPFPILNHALPISTKDDERAGGILRGTVIDVRLEPSWTTRVNVEYRQAELGTSNNPLLPVDLSEVTFRLSLHDPSASYPSGMRFELFQWISPSSNAFQLIEVPRGSRWDMSRLYSDGWVQIVSSDQIEFGYVSFYQSDLDQDGDVDTVDVLELIGNWTGAEANDPGVVPAHGDTDGDHDVDVSDQLFQLGQWTGAEPAGQFAVVPEPAGPPVSFACATLMLVTRRLKRQSRTSAC
jgi:hypothetical protein